MRLKIIADRRINSFSKKGKIDWKIRLLKRSTGKSKKILDVGCASGYLSKYLSNKENYYGIDFNEYLVDFCKNKKLNVKLCDLAKDKIPFESGFFEVVWCSHMIEHLTSREQITVFKEFDRVLKKNGKLIIFAPTPYHWYFWDDFTHVRPCTHGQLEFLALNAGFKKATGKYSKTRFFPNGLQRYLRLPPLRFFLWETFLVAEK